MRNRNTIEFLGVWERLNNAGFKPLEFEGFKTRAGLNSFVLTPRQWIPDPKSQVEQITIALIYKFMDDMDAESEELGGKRKFFTGDYARYGWAKLMAPSLGGHEMLGPYGEGISKMPENPGIPALFREIFKNAYSTAHLQHTCHHGTASTRRVSGNASSPP